MLLAAVSPTQFSDHDALRFSKDKPIMDIGKVKSVRKLVDRGTKEIVVESRPQGGGTVRPAQIGRAVSIYDIR